MCNVSKHVRCLRYRGAAYMILQSALPCLRCNAVSVALKDCTFVVLFTIRQGARRTASL